MTPGSNPVPPCIIPPHQLKQSPMRILLVITLAVILLLFLAPLLFSFLPSKVLGDLEQKLQNKNPDNTGPK